MGLSATHTHANLEVSDAAYQEIAERLRDAGYDHVFDEEGTIDMHGIGLVPGGDPISLHHLGVLRIRPGDTVVIRSPAQLTEAAIARLNDVVKKHLQDRPGLENVEVMVLDSGLELGVLRGKKPTKEVQALTVPCPTCKAPAGVQCRMLGTKERKAHPCIERYRVVLTLETTPAPLSDDEYLEMERLSPAHHPTPPSPSDQARHDELYTRYTMWGLQ